MASKEEDEFEFGEQLLQASNNIGSDDDDADFNIDDAAGGSSSLLMLRGSAAGGGGASMMTDAAKSAAAARHQHQHRFRREGSVGDDHDPLLGDDTFIQEDEPRPSTVVDPAMLNVSFDRLPKSTRPPPGRGINNNNNNNNNMMMMTMTPNNSKETNGKSKHKDKTGVVLPKALTGKQVAAYTNPQTLAFKLRDLNLRHIRVQQIVKYRETQQALTKNSEKDDDSAKSNGEGSSSSSSDDDLPLVDATKRKEKKEAKEERRRLRREKKEADKKNQLQQQLDKDAAASTDDKNEKNDDRNNNDNIMMMFPSPNDKSEEWNAHRRSRWSKVDTDAFYDGLRQFGTDFAAITRFFPSRDRNEIVRKFHSEMKTNNVKIQWCLVNQIPVDEAAFQAAAHDWTRKREMQDKGPLDEQAEQFLKMAGLEGATSFGAENNDDDDDEQQDQDGNNNGDGNGLDGASFLLFDSNEQDQHQQQGRGKKSTNINRKQPAIRQRTEFDLDFGADEMDLNQKSKRSNNNNNSIDHFNPLDPDDVPFIFRVTDTEENTPLGLLYGTNPQSQPQPQNNSNTAGSNIIADHSENNTKPAPKKGKQTTANNANVKNAKTNNNKNNIDGTSSMMTAPSGSTGMMMGMTGATGSAEDFLLDSTIQSKKSNEEDPFGLNEQQEL